MKKAAMVLGIVGGSIALAAALIYFLIAVFAIGVAGQVGETAYDYENGGQWDTFGDLPPGYDPSAVNTAVSDFRVWLPLIFLVVFGFIGGGLGLAGGILAQRRSVLAGVFMCVGGVLTIMLCITFILLVLGGIFALVRTKEDKAAVVDQGPVV